MPNSTLDKDNALEGYLRVSTILDYFSEPTLVDWYIEKGKEAKRIGKQAKKIGTEVDEAVKEFVASGTYGKVKTVEAMSCLDGFKLWYDRYKPSLTVGTRLFNEDLKITGEPDLYWDNTVIDIKCASEIRAKYHVQTAAYSRMANKDKTAILRLHKHLEDYEYQERSLEEVLSDTDCFLAYYTAYQHSNNFLMGRRSKYANRPADTSF